MDDPQAGARRGRWSWITLPVVGIVLATFLSDFGHEACTAVLPLYLGAIHLGPRDLGIIEGIADFLVSFSKLGGGVLGHYLRRKRPATALGYLITGCATAAIGLVQTLPAILTLRSIAWIGRGYRGPLRDFLLADAVEKTHYGRAYGLERAGDMLGAVAGPLVVALALWAGWTFQGIILWTFIPGVLAAAAIFFLTRDRGPVAATPSHDAPAAGGPRFPRRYWFFLVGVLLFGLGDFSRTFLIYLAAGGLGATHHEPGTLSIPILLYMLHNLVSAAAALLIGHWADRRSKLALLVAGYALGVGTNVLLAAYSGILAGVAAAIVMSGVYIAAEETLEKATAAEFLPRELRSLGLGILASANAVGDMVSSLFVGYWLQAGDPAIAFGAAAGVGALGVLWMLGFGLAAGRGPARAARRPTAGG